MKHSRFLVAVALSLASTAPAQSPQFREVFTSDSFVPAFAMTSPDARWIVMAQWEGALAGSLWMVSASGGAPFRLTSSGYNDGEPVWFASGDRIVFTSTRPNRNGGRQRYLMTLDIDRATGRAVGAPRQVTSEPVQTRGRPSADGKWILYIIPGAPATLKIVPANGGSARTIAQGTHPMNSVTFSPDGRYVYYGQQAGVGGRPCRADGWSCTSFSIKRVAIDGGTPVNVAEATHRIRVLAADPRYVQHQVSGTLGSNGVWELRDSTGRALGRIEFPDEIDHSSFTGDGWGVVGIKLNEERAVRVVPVAGGPIRTVTTAGRRWPEAWMPDNSALITDRRENGRIVVEVTSLDGKAVSQHALPASTQSSGWNSSVGPWFSYQPRGTGLNALNVVTGETKVISDSAGCCIPGRGGMDQDGPRWGYVTSNGNLTTYKTVDPATGGTSTIRTFSRGGPPRRYHKIHGTRLAWLEARGDSIDLMLSEDVAGPARRLFSSKGTLEGADEAIAWSWKGDRIALCGGATGIDPSLTILTLPPRGAPVARQDLPVGNSVGCWAPQWLPDDSGLLFLTIVDRQREDIPDLAFLSLQPGSQVRVLTKDEPREFWNYVTSPDGRYAAYAVDLPVSRASVYVASFKPLVEGRR